jgi:hypothetical protein
VLGRAGDETTVPMFEWRNFKLLFLRTVIFHILQPRRPKQSSGIRTSTYIFKKRVNELLIMRKPVCFLGWVVSFATKLRSFRFVFSTDRQSWRKFSAHNQGSNNKTRSGVGHARNESIHKIKSIPLSSHKPHSRIQEGVASHDDSTCLLHCL